MIIINQKIFIKANPYKVWKVFSRLENWHKLNPMHKYARRLYGKPWHINSKFEFYTDYGLIKSKSVALVLKSNPPNYVTWTGTKPFIRGEHTFIFRKIKNGAEVTNYEEFTGIALPLFRLLNMKPKVERSFRIFLNGLKREAEKSK